MPTPARTTKQPSTLPKFILLAVLLILAALGVWAYNSTTQTTKNNTTPTTTVPTDTTQAPANTPAQTPTDKQIFKIPELGIQMTLPAGLEGLEYEMQDSSYTDDSGKLIPRVSPAFTTSKLVELEKTCSFGSLGVILKVPSNTKPYGGDPMVKVDSFSVILSRPQSPCANNDSASSLQVAQMNLLKDALNSTNPIPTTDN